MCELGALVFKGVDLGDGRIQLCLLLRQIQPRGRSQLMAVAHEFERLALQFYILADHFDFGVKRPQGVIVGGKLGAEKQAHILVVAFCLLAGRLGTLYRAAHTAGKISFITDTQAQREIVLGHRNRREQGTGRRPVLGSLRPHGTGSQV
ncbi:hypothetical protein GALL_386390 [mine drainage metagenome]|uniref:Uncharacterized protein n=1 Tax=mine drainage metagenome TaxID=410659 RepID=A0A1J5Q7J4_9ZZZZ